MAPNLQEDAVDIAPTFFLVRNAWQGSQLRLQALTRQVSCCDFSLLIYWFVYF